MSWSYAAGSGSRLMGGGGGPRNGTTTSSPSSVLSYTPQQAVIALPLPKWGTVTATPTIAAVPNLKEQQLQKQQRFKVFCDLDGVLVDFEHGIRKLFPEYYATSPLSAKTTSFQLQDLEKSTMWKRVAAADAFFERLPWAPGGKKLWQAIRHLQPDILTGVPCHDSSRVEKYRWCQRELGCMSEGSQDRIFWKHVDMADHRGHHVNHNMNNDHHHDHHHHHHADAHREGVLCRVITCWSTNKHYESGPGAVLIDDRESLRHDWEAKGGIFIHHETGNVDRTLEQLQQFGILPPMPSTFSS